ncbi:DUF3979 family protein [Ectobacillus ponti]|uniref:DUF3979 family protein n=1 Tax=Ectobacillus ponti TaxID=2961894 RepID=A0AA42BP95_9BACI|nr:DUF3979 family protein [Ectobacillus ponti]MCP8968875.1 DUF3979 family protein [Ectobacillus ponti]
MIQEALRAFFQSEPGECRTGHRYVLTEQDGTYSISSDAAVEYTGNRIIIECTEENEVRIVLQQAGRPLVHVQRIEMERVVPIRDDGEEALQFVLARMSSRMIQVQLKPFFAVEMGLFWEFCDDCDE